MEAIRAREFYLQGFRYFDFAAPVRSILRRVIAGDDRAEDFEEAIRVDAYLTRRVISHAAEALRSGKVSTLSHAVVLLGKDNVRDFVLAQCLRREFEVDADQEAALSFDMAKSRLRRAHAAEDLARRAGVDSVGAAFAAGYLFDVFEFWLESRPALGGFAKNLLEETWAHGCQAALIAWDIAHHSAMSGTLKKLSFVSGLTHDIGRLLLAFAFPSQWRAQESVWTNLHNQVADDDSAEAKWERATFPLSHAEAGSLLLWRTGVLGEYEFAIEHHHDDRILQSRDVEQDRLSLVLRLADRLSCLITTQASPELPLLEKILHESAVPKAFSAQELSGVLLSLRSRELLRGSPSQGSPSMNGY